jgi:hypothetical protein
METKKEAHETFTARLEQARAARRQLLDLTESILARCGLASLPISEMHGRLARVGARAPISWGRGSLAVP